VSNRVVVIGAGLAGLMAAGEIAGHGIDVVVLDKGRGVGGRMATRRIAAPNGRTALLDHGAQFFTVRHDEFARLVEASHTSGVVVSNQMMATRVMSDRKECLALQNI